jgi:hypothetical protein
VSIITFTFITSLTNSSQTQKTPSKTASESSSTNIFDDLPALRPPKAAVHRDELEKYLSTDRELHVNDGLLWWHERKHIYPRLSRMALDYLSIPGKLSFFNVNGVTHLYILFAATSVHVERTFSQGRLLLSHVRSCLSVQSTRALLCVGVWSLLGYVKDSDVKAAAVLPAVDGEEEELAEDWDSIDAP